MSEGESSETSEDGYIEQSFEVKVYSTYATFGHLKSILDTMVGYQGVFSHLCTIIYWQRFSPSTYLEKHVKNMADQVERVHLDLRAKNDRSERDDLFWNTSLVKTKFSLDKAWIKSVRKAKNKPNYGLGRWILFMRRCVEINSNFLDHSSIHICGN